MLPKKLNDAVSAGVKNNILPPLSSSYISVPYSLAVASDDKGNLKLFARNANRFDPRPTKGIAMNLMFKLAIKNKPVQIYVIKRNIEYKFEL